MKVRKKRIGLPYSRPQRPRLDYQKVDKLGRFTDQRDEEVWEFILRYTVQHMGHTPALREICANTGITSTSAISVTIQRLILKGKLQRDDGQIVLPGSSFTWNPPDPDAPGAFPAAHRAVDYSADAESWF